MNSGNNNQILSLEDRMRATEMFLRGESKEQILSQFPGHTSEIEELFAEVVAMKELHDVPQQTL